MSSTSITTVIQMLESLPETAQDRVVERLREYIADLQDELEWDSQFKNTEPQLVAGAQRARGAIGEGQAAPLDYDGGNVNDPRPRDPAAADVADADGGSAAGRT